jgi:hypothetical protein
VAISIGHDGGTLHVERGWLSGCHRERIKAERPAQVHESYHKRQTMLFPSIRSGV